MDATNHDDVINSTTNWRLAGGSLTDSISFESSFSTTTANLESDDGAAVDHAVKSPLLLLPPITDAEPCEITIAFAQEHELRQVYIRSTARVYEVYYTKKLGDDKEYLCTVRCGIAMRAEEVLQIIPLTESAASKNQVEPLKDDSIERKVKDNGNGRTNEDGWVEVKAGDASLLNNEKDLLSMPQLGKQDFYEATAEINDAEPCISVTLRLLSLQDKRCPLVDEVYVFADPIDPSESEQEEASGTGNSSSSALMAMFMPTLLQLSRGRDVRKEQERQVSDKSNSTNLGTLGNSNESRASSPVLVDTLAKRVDAATGVSEAEIKPAISCSNVETILHHLVNKVSRMETILTRFEDQMLKPINSIDARLQLVEKKLEHLGKKSFESELRVETTIPNPSSLGSDTDKPPETDELDKNRDNPQLSPCTKTVVPDSCSIEKCEDYAVVLPKNRLDSSFTKFEEPGSENNSISRNEMISAESEISDKEVGHSLGRESFEEKPKRSVSINDALASALAGLLSSTSTTDGKYSQALVVTAPEFSNEDDMEMEEKPPTGTRPDKSQVAAEELGNTYSASESPTSSQKEPGITLCDVDDSQEMNNGVSGKFGDNAGGYADAETVVSVRNVDLDEETVSFSTKADGHTERESLSYEPRNPDTLVHELENPNVTTDCGSSKIFATKECEEEPEKTDDVLKSVLGFQPATSSVDFQTPVLDVKFNSEEKVSDNKCFFEALFTEECKNVVDCNNKGFDDNLVSVEDEELKGPPTDTLSSVEMDHYEMDNELHLQLNAEMSTASLI
ncbi:hypothetical protein EUTSA_v10003674mg [Eutrema salsugineum]|uniref:Uncharacterized protein n=1 Tax=Eutrema salsugineum TaxID=72664 RepID=V4KYL4_EUTSA|nr:hypothetical protein EUTSA_v10003674mg [Eutrema salsugineum]